MRGQIPIEAPRSRNARFAVRPLAFVLVWVFTSAGIAAAWLALNAFFLQCRDAKLQAFVVGAGLLIALASRWFIFGLFAADALPDPLTREQVLMVSLGKEFAILLLACVICFLVLRQVGPAAYRKSLYGKIAWGLPAIGALALARYFIFSAIGEPWGSVIKQLFLV